jgi:tellurite resistance protein
MYRFDEEVNLVKILEKDFGFKNYYGLADYEESLKNMQNSLLSKGVKLNKVIAPRLYQICNSVKEKLNYTEDIDFYILSDVWFNAYSIHGFNHCPHMICLTSSLVQNFSDEELAFVIAHEIGHLMFLHSQLSVIGQMLFSSKDKRVPAQVRNIYLRWNKYAEISCDRVGYIAQPNLEIIGRVFFKLVSGLSEEHLKFDIKEYMKQLDMIKDMSQGEFQASHPISLVRLKCLELFSKSDFYHDCKNNQMTTDELQKELSEILSLLEYHPRNENQKKAIEFTASVGMYVACADNSINQKETEILYELLANYTSQPDHYLKFNDLEEVITRKNEICEYYANANNDYKFELYEDIIFMAICDGQLDETEKTALFEIAQRLKIEEKRAKETIADMVWKYLNVKIENPTNTNPFPINFNNSQS